MQRLREGTREAHEALERLPFAQSLGQGTLGRAAYVNYLHAMAILQAQIEQTASSSDRKAIGEVWNSDMRKHHLIARDLAALGADDAPDHLTLAVAEALVLAQQMRLRVKENPLAYLGDLYVFEGSTLGGAILSRTLAQAQEFGPDTVGYLASYGSRRSAHWKAFGARVEAVVTDEAQARTVVQAATNCFEQLIQLFGALDKDARGESGEHPVIALNPSAGDHPISCDPVELDVALRAGESTLDEFPYVLERFGERGLRFSRSDSGWLLSNLSQSEARMNQDIRWLGQVLAARGMPRLLLESHLASLHGALLRARPNAGGRYDRLLQAAIMLRTERQRHLNDRDLDELDEAFARAVAATGIPYANVGRLIGSAVADEQNGVRQAVPSLTRWLTDAERFPAPWSRAVNETLASAERKAQRSGHDGT